MVLAVAVPKDAAFLAMRRALELLGEEEGTAKGAPTVIYMYPRLPGPLMCVDRPAGWSTCLPGWPAEILRRIAEEFGGKIVEVP